MNSRRKITIIYQIAGGKIEKLEKIWFVAIMERHNLTLRSPEAISLGRAISFKREAVKFCLTLSLKSLNDIVFLHSLFTMWMGRDVPQCKHLVRLLQ